ncbi:DNA repair protein RecN [Sediminibacterium sp.]|uniref:DNA repair protein RecN n=1 Tax=Sediminibacterium sp. TaxID=1917865 RepID=UPI002732C2D0|nr:DNA repair protein RecN [Sediminibacterium sp.]MDP3567427.1 DNA repair protein RecN [Sediminibacterium sp.]
MLKRLYISNFALINEMDVSFPGKLSVITGETGAGKSIFLEALGLVLGNRADLATLQNKNKKCIIEAEFETKGLELKNFFEENDLDYDSIILLRREISTEGKSRSFLNDTPVGLNTLKLLSEKLIDIHSQHQTLLLNQTNFQLEVLDAFAGSLNEFKEYKNEYSKLNKLNGVLKNLKEQETQAKKELDYFQFLFNELEETEIKKDGLKLLEEESATLENAETIKSTLLNTVNAINGGEVNLLSALSIAKQNLQGLSKYGKNYLEFFERINSAYIELKDIAIELENAEDEISFDTIKLSEINAKMDKLNRLLKKHNVSNEEELISVKNDIENKLAKFESIENDINETQKQIDKLNSKCSDSAKKLSKTRLSSVSEIEKKVKEVLADLSMQNANFKIDISQTKELTPTGFDQVKFLFSANKGASLNELNKVASGGELSRLMLCLKALLASKKQLPTIIFDEIDTGVSGDVADKIGSILLKMGKTMQVVAITHLPQMASKGDHHLFVYKEDDTDVTISHIKQLSKDERINEIAKMLSTGNPTATALKNAKELLNA